MSLTLPPLADPTTLVDPYQLTDPTRLAPPAYAPLVVPGVKPVGHDLAPVALGIAAAFMATRALMSVSLLNDDPPAGRGLELVDKAWRAVAPKWVRWALPALVQAYQLGSTNRLSAAEVTETARVYVQGLGDYLQQTSAQALADGYLAGLSYGWSPQLAWMRAAEGFGLDRVQMRAYLSSLAATVAHAPAQLHYTTDVVPPTARSLLDRALGLRAHRIGHNEAWNAAEVGKVVAWLVEQHRGSLPVGTRKRWVTAHDERVCGVCGGLDAQVVDLPERFEVPGGEGLIAPGAHPNCRCSVELVYPTVEVIKNAPGDPYDRNARGEFAAQESRSAKLKPLRRVTQVRTKTPGQEVYERTMQPTAEPTKAPFVEPTQPFVEAKARFTEPAPFSDQPKAAFADTGAFTEPRTPAAKTPFGTAAFGAKEWSTGPRVHLIRRVVFADNVPKVITQEVTTHTAGRYDTSLFLSGYEIHTAMDEHGMAVPDELVPGDVVDFDELATPVHPSRQSVSEVYGFEDDPHSDTPHALYRVLEDEDTRMSAARHQDEMLEQDVMIAQDHEAAHLSESPQYYLDRMSDRQLDQVLLECDDSYRDLPREQARDGLAHKLSTMTARDKREEILNHLDSGDSSWWDSLLETVVYSGEEDLQGDDMRHAWRAYEDDSLDETLTPTVYVLHGWDGSYLEHAKGVPTKTNRAIPEGRYRVTRVTRHTAADVPFVGFEDYLRVDLTPVERS